MSPTRASLLAVIALTAASMLGWEVLLTRLASLRYHFHFGHVAVSNGLLGVGLAGTALALTRPRWQANPVQSLQWLLPWYASSLALAWAILYILPVHQGSMSWAGTTSFLVFMLASLLPFITGGAVIGLLLSGWSKVAASLYSADLLAAGAICILIPWWLPQLGMGGVLAIMVAFACAAAALVTHRRWWAAVLSLCAVAPFIDGIQPAPSKIERTILHSSWTALSRVDIVDVPLQQRNIRSRGQPVQPADVPEQIEIMQDGSASTLMSNYGGHPTALKLLDDTLFSAASRLRSGGQMLVIGFGGGDDLWAARNQGITSIDAVDLNAPVLSAHNHFRPTWSAPLQNEPEISMVISEGRNTLMRSQDSYDLVQLTGIDTWTALTSGAYMLAENHLYTTEAFGQMLDRLRPSGILQITRMAAEMEALRVLVQLRVVHDERSKVPFEQAVAVLGSTDHQVATLMQPDGFSSDEIETLSTWATKAGLFIHHLPGHATEGLIQRFIHEPDPTAFVDAFPRNIRPTTDDRPYFFQFTRWTRPTEAAKTIREPTYISQGNPLFLVAQLGWSIIVAAFLLCGPLARRSRPNASTVVRFAGLGAGYIMIELAFMNKLILLLGHPMRALSVTLASMLIASGLGAWTSTRVRSLQGVWTFVALFAGLFVWWMPELLTHSAQWSVELRSLVAAAAIAPVGFAMGIPFAWLLVRLPTDQVPWAWATNALFTVLGAQLVIIASMTLGFNITLLGGALVYGLAFLYSGETA